MIVATVLAYTSPALGHLLPIGALMAELCSRGHTVHMRTLSGGVAIAKRLGFTADAIDPRIEAIEMDDWKGRNPIAALRLSAAAFARRAALEVDDLTEAVALVKPDGLIVDVNSWGAFSAAEAGDVRWACVSPYIPPLRSQGVPPFGLGLRPLAGPLGAIRDAAVRALVFSGVENVMLPRINAVRANVGVAPIASVDEFLRRSPLMMITTAKPFQYPQTVWGGGVQMIGPCDLDPVGDTELDWLAAIERPIVLVTSSSEKQADFDLVPTALSALADEPVHVIATMPAGQRDGVAVPHNATLSEVLPHGVILDRAVCAVTHGGMGVTQKALARGVPVCAVPYGRDQFEVARRVEVAGCGTRLPARRLSPPRLREKVRQAMKMTDGARRVADGFEAAGGVARGADLVEQRVFG